MIFDYPSKVVELKEEEVKSEELNASEFKEEVK